MGCYKTDVVEEVVHLKDQAWVLQMKQESGGQGCYGSGLHGTLILSSVGIPLALIPSRGEEILSSFDEREDHSVNAWEEWMTLEVVGGSFLPLWSYFHCHDLFADFQALADGMVQSHKGFLGPFAMHQRSP